MVTLIYLFAILIFRNYIFQRSVYVCVCVRVCVCVGGCVISLIKINGLIVTVQQVPNV